MATHERAGPLPSAHPGARRGRRYSSEQASTGSRRRLLAAGAGCLAAALCPARAATEPEAPAPLTPEQRTWLTRHSPIRWLPEKDYAPFVSVGSDGLARGLSVDVLSRVAALTGIELEPMQARPLKEQLALVSKRFGDLITSVRPTPERAAYLHFTRPYVSVPTLLVAGDAGPGAQRPGWRGLADLSQRTVAVGSGFAVEAVVRAGYPEVDWRGVPSDLDALEGIVDGRYAAAVVDAASAGHLMTQPRLAGLRAVADIGFRYELCFGVRSDWPELRDILDLGIAALPRTELAALRQQWLRVPGADAAPSHAPLATGMGASLLLAGVAGAAVMAWRRRRRGIAPGAQG